MLILRMMKGSLGPTVEVVDQGSCHVREPREISGPDTMGTLTEWMDGMSPLVSGARNAERGRGHSRCSGPAR